MCTDLKFALMTTVAILSVLVVFGIIVFTH
ncbi:YnhF family membrane protein [Gilliamella sp. B2776]|nr:YnhF family membrane protein [Gilliamella sp. B2779]MCX8654758.1 YnhF family membrane protein [Gilliamella sp. B2737]MCX8655778.1 YnhF family membrane protein [Gilliamella sp. B2894]MCX8663881.1 YnhF family membrane protein [Gilliamella sp. B2887]MCX8691124.1 YnhF family membrane protein [Gilliamella sp. B2776]MCX8694677.1 YnhF family membrane protein [Gilliamella sp. B2881]MCX8695276.1 YnhF family membrane protein [Gilliamella sp. B2828]MCX8697919.1 YnhF family membrane protein [Gilliame